MFYEVRILDSRGKVKKVLSSKKLSVGYWEGFYEKIKRKSLPRSGAVKRKGRQLFKLGKQNADKFEDEYSLMTDD